MKTELSEAQMRLVNVCFEMVYGRRVQNFIDHVRYVDDRPIASLKNKILALQVVLISKDYEPVHYVAFYTSADVKDKDVIFFCTVTF